MKKNITLSLDQKLVKLARVILSEPPKKSLSSFVEEKIYELIKKNGEKND